MLANYLFVFICFFIDGILNTMFPVSFGFENMYFVPCVGFSAFVLVIRKIDALDGFLLAFLTGIYYGVFFGNNMFLYLVLFLFIYLVLSLWIKQVNDSLIENIVLCISTIFIKELVLYFYMRISEYSVIHFNDWLINRMFLTILVNAAIIVILVFLSYTKEDYLKQKDIRIRKEEKLPWLH